MALKGEAAAKSTAAPWTQRPRQGLNRARKTCGKVRAHTHRAHAHRAARGRLARLVKLPPDALFGACAPARLLCRCLAVWGCCVLPTEPVLPASMKTYARRKRAAGCDAAGGPAKRAALAPDVVEAGGALEGGADPYAFSTSDEEDASPLPPARECSRVTKLLQAPIAAPSKARWGSAANGTRPPPAGGQAAASAAGTGSPGGPACPQGPALYAQHDPDFLRGLVALHGRADSGGDAHSPPASAGAPNGPARRCSQSPLCMPVPAPTFPCSGTRGSGPPDLVETSRAGNSG